MEDLKQRAQKASEVINKVLDETGLMLTVSLIEKPVAQIVEQAKPEPEPTEATE